MPMLSRSPIGTMLTANERDEKWAAEIRREEAAALDGATPWQAFRLVLLPLSVPILAVVFILSFIGAVTEVPIASLLLRDVGSYTLKPQFRTTLPTPSGTMMGWAAASLRRLGRCRWS